MKCSPLGLLALLLSFAVHAEPAVNTMPDQAATQTTTQNTQENSSPDVTTSKNKGADNSQNDRQFLLPSGPGAIPVDVTDDKKIEKPAGTAVPSDSTKEKTAESVKEKWGVDNFRVRLTSAGYMLDVRYRVYDKTKAKPLFSRKLRPFAIEEASDVKYGVPASPKVGFLRQTPQHIKENKEYFLMIANPGKRIKSGDKLTLVIGDFRIEHLTVE